MAVIDAGRVCKKTHGLDAGKICVILGKAEKGQVSVMGPNMKKAKVNINHLEPLPNVVKAGKDITQAEITELLRNEGLIL
ncbi:MAG: 50S ribosomal protein L14e [Candidatus Altiarchaeales archaeon]|nr:50S ribosomal protein L14e [Candidatus Altiarchaeales archaeon]